MIKNFQNKCQGKAIRVISDTRVLIETLVEFSEVEKRGNNIRERVMHQYAENIFEMKSHGVFFPVCTELESKILNRHYPSKRWYNGDAGVVLITRC